jgi:K+-sensing histidine kinase KdpD
MDYYFQKDIAPVMSIGQWLVTFLLMAIPIVNIIMIIVWLASKNENPNRKNWVLAYLIVIAISVVLTFIIFGSVASFFSAIGSIL